MMVMQGNDLNQWNILETGNGERGCMYETRRLNILMPGAFKIRRELFIHV